MVENKWCPDCGDVKPAGDFTKDKGRRDGLAAYCRTHARSRVAESRRRLGEPKHRFPVGIEVPVGQKWCPDCETVQALEAFPTTPRAASGRHTYCKPCHNERGRKSLAKVGGSRTYHLKRRYGITAAEADVMFEAQGGLCAICRSAPAAHVDHDHATNAVRELLCFNCNGGLGQFRDDPAVLLAAVAYLEKHRPEPEPPAAGCTTTPRLGSDRRDRRGTRPGRRSTDRPAPGSVGQLDSGPQGPAEEAHG